MAKSISAAFIQELNARTDLLKVIGLRIDFRKHSGKNHFACCPFHNEKSPSFSVNEAEQYYYCFGCGARGDAIRFLMDHDHLTFVEAVESLAEFNGMDVVYEEYNSKHQAPPRDKQRYEQGLACLAEAAEYFQQMFYADAGRQAREYLRGRQVNKSSVDYFQLGYAPRGNGLIEVLGRRYSHDILQATGLIGIKDGRHYDWFRDRVMFPIRNVRGQVIGFGARAMGDGEPKYLNSSESDWFNKRHECYGLYEALQNGKRNQALLVTEGYMDVLKMHQHGMDNAVAALGTAIGETHITQLKKRTKKVYFAFDGDTAGQKAAINALEAVFRLYDEQHQWRFMFMPDGEDPDSLIEQRGIAAIQGLMDSSLTASQFLLHLLDLKLAGRQSAEAGAEVAAAAREWLAMLPQGTYQTLLREEVQTRFGLQSSMVDQSNLVDARKRSYRQHRVTYAISSAPQPLDIRLTAMLVHDSSLVWKVLPSRYGVDLQQVLPLFCRTCYMLHSGADLTAVQAWLEQADLSHEIQTAQQALDGMTTQAIAAELEDSIRLRVQRLLDQQHRLEKLGG